MIKKSNILPILIILTVFFSIHISCELGVSTIANRIYSISTF